MPLPVFSPVLLLLAPQPQAAPASSPGAKPPAASRAAAPKMPLRFDLQITRTDSAPGAATPDAAAQAPATAPAAPTILATPILNTLDMGTAAITVTNPDFGYAIALSPTLENAEKSINGAGVLTLWNLRLSGRSLPGGTNTVTLTGSTRIPTSGSGDTVIAEVPLRDPKTGQTSLFRLSARVTVGASPNASH